MRAWKILVALAVLSIIGVGAHAAYVQYIALADVKANDSGLSYFGGSHPVKYWNFRGQNRSTTIGNAGQEFPNTTPSLNGTSNRKMDVPLIPYDADAGTALLGELLMNPRPSPSPAISSACTLEGDIRPIQGHASSNSTTVTCCWKSGQLTYQRGMGCQ